jgi:hypothetical protein
LSGTVHLHTYPSNNFICIPHGIRAELRPADAVRVVLGRIDEDFLGLCITAFDCSRVVDDLGRRPIAGQQITTIVLSRY